MTECDLFVVLFENVSLINKGASSSLQNVDLCLALTTGRDLYRATHAIKRGFGFLGSYPKNRDSPVFLFLRETRAGLRIITCGATLKGRLKHIPVRPPIFI